MKTKILLTAILSILLIPQAFAFNQSDYQYFRDISGTVESQSKIVLDIDQDIQKKSSYLDLKIINQEDQEVPSKVINRDYKLITSQAKIIMPESGAKMLDGNLDTSFNFPVSISEAVILIDLGEGNSANVIDFVLAPKSKLWNNSSLEGSQDNIIFTTIQNPVEHNRELDSFFTLKSNSYRYLRVTLNLKSDLEISEILIYKSQSSKILFNAEASQTYRLFYGNLKKDILPLIEKGVDLTVENNLPILTLGEEQLNEGYNSDLDQDGISNAKDNCPLDSNADQKDNDKDSIGDECDLSPFMLSNVNQDSDYDLIDDYIDNCPYLKNTNQLDSNRNQIGDICEDNDTDGILNALDNCIDVGNYDQLDSDQNGIGDVCEGDYDQDGIKQDVDNCKNISNPDQSDVDEDKIGDVCDNCANMFNPAQMDFDQNGIGDECEDEDGDGLINTLDNCVAVSNPDQVDTDQDNKGDVCDNCINIVNSSQWDDDNDGIGNECDDDDNDGILNSLDNCPLFSNLDQLDSDGDGRGDACKDSDNDGIADASDNCIQIENANQIDQDRDGIGDACDEQVEIITQQGGVYQYLFWGVLSVMGLTFVYYSFQLIRQIASKEDEE